MDTHSLLLSLAGLVDDELLGWSRELVAVGESGYALELVTASIAAEGTRLPDSVHTGLRAARREPAGVQLPAPVPAPVMAHRFLADPATAGYPPAVAASFPIQALHTMPGRILRGCRLRLSWRLTPAGSAPAPVPHPVLLIETADGTGADLLAYQVADLLWQAGVFASVEVFGPDTPLGEYHRAALEASLPLEDRDLPPAGARLAAESSAGVAAQSSAGVAAGGLGSGQDPVRTDPAPTPTGTPAPVREPAARSPLPPADRVIAARASAPNAQVHNAMPFGWAPQERPAREKHADGADLGGHQGPGNQAGSAGRQHWTPAQAAAPRREPAGPPAAGRPPAGSFAPPRGNPPPPSGPLPPRRPPAPQGPQQAGAEGAPLVSQPPARRPGPPPAQPPPTHPARPPRRPTEDTPETPDDTLRSPRQPLEERDTTGNTRRSH
jgi:hypothetical protein